jgi:hypothetical protein
MKERRLTSRDFSLFAEAWVFLLRARLMLVFRPFNQIVPLLKNADHSQAEAGVQLLEEIKLAIARASVKSPWRTKCFEQALAARMMLKRRGIATVTYFGVLKNNEDKIEAHAWLKCGEFVVTGWRRISEYNIIGRF